MQAVSPVSATVRLQDRAMITLDQLVIFAVRGGKTQLVRECLEAGGNPSYFDSRHGAALFVAINSQQVEMIHLLMEYGANINMTDERGFGALEYALRTSDHAVIAAVLRYGATLKAHREHWHEALRRHFAA